MSKVKEIVDMIDVFEKQLCCQHAVHEHTLQLIEETYKTKFQYHHQAMKFLRKKVLDEELEASEKVELIERLQYKS